MEKFRLFELISFAYLLVLGWPVTAALSLGNRNGTDEAVAFINCPDTNRLISHPQYCDQYINCWEGEGVIGHCHHGLFFNPVNFTCDYPFNVDCEDRTDSRPQSDNGICQESYYGTFENPDNCGQFVVCQGGVPSVFDCPKGLVYNVTLGVCVDGDKSCLDMTTEQSVQPDSEPSTSTPLPEAPNDLPQEQIPDLNPSTIFPTKPVGPNANNSNSVLFPVLPSWPLMKSVTTVNCPVVGFANGNPVYAAICVNAGQN